MSGQKEEIVCLICGQDFSGAASEEMFFHAITNHPIEFLQSPKAQQFLFGVQQKLYDLGVKFGQKLRGA